MLTDFIICPKCKNILEHKCDVTCNCGFVFDHAMYEKGKYNALHKAHIPEFRTNNEKLSCYLGYKRYKTFTH